MADGNYTPSGFILGEARVFAPAPFPAGGAQSPAPYPLAVETLVEQTPRASESASVRQTDATMPPSPPCACVPPPLPPSSHAPSSPRIFPLSPALLNANWHAELHDLPRYDLQFRAVTNELAIPPEGAYIQGVVFYLLFFIAVAIALVVWAGCSCCSCLCRKKEYVLLAAPAAGAGACKPLFLRRG